MRKLASREIWSELKWASQCAFTHRTSIALYTLLGILSAGFGLVSSIFLKNLIDAVEARELTAVLGAACVMAAALAANVLLGALTSRVTARISIKVRNSIQSSVYDRIMVANWEDIGEYRSGDLLNRLTSDVSTVATNTITIAPTCVTSAMQFLGSLAVIFYYDWIMGLLALIGVPLTALLTRLAVDRMRRSNKRMKEADAALMAFCEDSVSNVQTIKAFDIAALFGRNMRAVQEESKAAHLKYNWLSVMAHSAMGVVGLIVSGGCFGWSVFRLWQGVISFGTMTMFLQLSSRLTAAFSSLAGLIPALIATATSSGRIMELCGLDSEDGAADAGDAACAGVYLNGVSFTYKDGVEAIVNSTLYARRGETIAIVGPSGRGKTTLIRILLGLLEPDSGEAYVDCGEGVRADISPATRKLFSYVPQGNTIFAGTIAQNLRLAKDDATDAELAAVLELAQAHDFVRELPDGIDTVVGERGKGLSEGQAQRLAIARALLRGAPVLLMDEATSALDMDMEAKLLEGLEEFRRDRVCIIATHRTRILAACDRVYMVDGRNTRLMTAAEVAALAGEER
ncbi:MAG: ABC transporter ATP-binding protein [Clostridia bacterium]|nr:ABC transporter ATP-binding protein [Clostridia bacterium]